MHINLRLKDAMELKQMLLNGYDNGQLEMETRSGMYRGQIGNWSVSNAPGEKIIRVEWVWYCREGFAFAEYDLRVTKWFKEPMPSLPLGPPCLEIKYLWYYYQKDKDRIKVMSVMPGEVFRFYRRNHKTNLILNGQGEYRQDL